MPESPRRSDSEHTVGALAASPAAVSRTRRGARLPVINLTPGLTRRLSRTYGHSPASAWARH
jgi:hypothetical protein